MTYRFIVSRARSMTTCQTLHTASCHNARRVTRPVRTFSSDGDNAIDALANYRKSHTFVAEPANCCLRGAW